MTSTLPTLSTPHAPPLVSAIGLSRRFGGVTAVSEVDLEVQPGEIVGIIGPNGAGKSTLLSLLSGARRPSAGSLHVCGSDFLRIRQSDAARVGVGLAHQVPKPFRRLTVRQNVEIASYVVPRGRRRKVVEEALRLSGLADRADKPAGSLGLLELKRLEVARVLAIEPQLVLLDEVAAGLTGADLEELIELIRAVHAQGKTIVLVEHVQQVIHQLAQRVVVLEWGHKLTEGTPEAVSADPRVVETYLGTAGQASLAQRRSRPSGEPRLEIRGAHSGYGPVNVLRDVDLSVRPGEIVAVLGSNGAGKTTLAKTLQGMVPLRRGRLLYNGTDISTMPAHERTRQGIALVAEGRRLFGELTVRENLQLGLRSVRDESPLERVHDIFPKLVELADRPAGALSGGEQQMVAIGRALAGEPQVVVFDELSLGLAPIIVDRMLEAAARVADWGTSVVLIEQNVHQALALADRIVVLRRGEVVFTGQPADISEAQLQGAYLGAQ